MHDRALRMALAAALAASLAACDDAGDAAQPTAEHTVDPATGETRMTIHGKDGPATLHAGPAVPVSLPPGFTLPPGARVTSNALAARPGGQGVLLSFETDAPAPEVIAHTRREAEAAGFRIEIDLDTAEARTIAGVRAKDRATVSLTVTQGTPATAQLALSAGGG
ncbi:hypothetical protein [Erythrobacter colymbi]|uniref:hypothetical protein n=1 Tax=Erythrobacter colymbi TaxID=1161202 RepID=UPI001180D744|nr:hypothetical protein [Erythrobacter colymbi]